MVLLLGLTRTEQFALGARLKEVDDRCLSKQLSGEFMRRLLF